MITLPLSPTELLTVIAIARKEAEKVIPNFRQPSDGKDGVNGIDGKDGNDGKDGLNGLDGTNGRDGRDGANGLDGANGRDGKDGKDAIAKDGKDGKDGRDGKDGTGIDEVAIGDDGHLYVGFDDGRVVDAGRVRGKDGKDGKDGKTIIGGGGGGTVVLPSSGTQETFETVNKNLKAYAATMTYGPDGLETVTYSNGVVKTLAYSPSGLLSVTLSGSTPSGISLVKTFNYSGGNLTGFSYS